MKKITEAQIRQVVRQELEQFLFEQQEENKKQQKSKFFTLFIPAIAVSMLLAQGHTSQSLAGDGGQGGSGKPETYEQKMLEQGINPNEAERLFYLAGFDKQSSTKLSRIFSQIQQNNELSSELQKSIDRKPENDPDRIKRQEQLKIVQANLKELDKTIANDEKISKGLLEAGPMALQYLFNKGALTGNQKEDYKKMMQYGIENAPLIAAQQAEKDLQIYANNLGILAPIRPEEKIIGWLNKTHPEITSELTADPNNSWTNIELLKILTKIDDNYKPTTFQYFDPEGVAISTANQLLDNPENSYDASEAVDAIEKVQKSATSKEYHPDKMTDEEIEAIQDPETRRILKAEKARLTGNVQENKVNKLRQRLNELRGVYV